MKTPGRDKPALVLGFPDDLAQARALAACAGIDCHALDVHRFPDGESRVRLPAALPASVAIHCSLNDANRRLVELEIAAAAALELGASRLTLVAPYLGYMRQDIAFRPGEAVSQRIVGALLARRFDTIVTVDPHLHRTHALVDAVPCRRAMVLSAAPVMGEWLAALSDSPVLIGPDSESRQWVRAIAEPAALEFAIADKMRLGDRDVRISLPEIALDGRPVVLVDDVASTGETLIRTATEIAARGAASVSVLVTHALFVGDALERLRGAGVDEVISTDSITHETNRLPLAPLLAGALDEH